MFILQRAGQSPQQRTICTPMSEVPRLRNPDRDHLREARSSVNRDRGTGCDFSDGTRMSKGTGVRKPKTSWWA